MNYLTMFVDIAEDIFTHKIKPYDSIKSISISEFNKNELVNTYFWEIAPSSKSENLLPYLHEVWEDIQPLIFNKTVIMFDANFTVEIIIKTFEYLINKTKPKTKPAERYFPNLLPKLQAIRFDFMCLSLICRRLFKDLHSNKLYNICEYVNIAYGKTSQEHSEALGKLFLYVINKLNCKSFIDLKHLSGITLGQIARNISLRESKTQDGKIIEYDKYYYPCVAITDEEIFKKYILVAQDE